MIITRTPFRVSLAGGGSDLPVYYREHGGGAVVSFSINKYIYLSMHPLFDDHRFLLKYSKTEDVARLDEIQHPIVRQVFTDYGICGVDFNSSADIPAGTGLGSSSAFTVGLTQLCDSYTGRYHSREELAAYACEVEIDKLREPIGKQDQYACACGGVNFIRFEDDESVFVDKIYLTGDLIARLESHFIMFYTGISRSAGTILREQRENTRANVSKVNNLKRMVKMAEELRTELCNGNIDAIGDILHQGWMYKRELASSVTNPAIDSYYDAAIRAGAKGGKLLGAGGGGFLLFYVSPESKDSIRRALSNLPELHMQIDRMGASVIYYDH